MQFQDFPLTEANGVILAHSLGLGETRLKKGARLDPGALAALDRAGVRRVIGVRLDQGDIAEDQAAAALAEAVAGANLRLGPAATGRVNLFATNAGVLRIDEARIHALNRIDEAVTIATLPPWQVVQPGRMAATVKIIPFAVGRELLERCLAVARQGLAVVPFQGVSVGLVRTAPQKTEAIETRIDAFGGRLNAVHDCAHAADDLASVLRQQIAEGVQLVLVSGAAATMDRRDVVPSAITQAGGTVLHYGMPVDPGNLLLLGKIGPVWVVNLPGCGRSPRPSGLDWVLARLMAGIPVGSADISGMGVGGLLLGGADDADG